MERFRACGARRRDENVVIRLTCVLCALGVALVALDGTRDGDVGDGGALLTRHARTRWSGEQNHWRVREAVEFVELINVSINSANEFHTYSLDELAKLDLPLSAALGFVMNEARMIPCRTIVHPIQIRL